LNENLCHALLHAQLSEEDVAACLQVDPKTVRRWLDGRMPYLRHRWALAALVGEDEVDLWPQLRATRTRPAEVQAIYPHRDDVPRELWLRFFGSADREIGILAHSGLFLAQDPETLRTLTVKARAGITMRICLADPDAAGLEAFAGKEGGDKLRAHIRSALSLYAPLRENDPVEIRLYRAVLYQSIYRADGQLLVSQHAHGIPAARSPVLHIATADGDLAAAYIETFDHVWAHAARMT